MKKNFSISKLYSDLQKYEANLNGIKDSRLKKQASGASLHQRPSSPFQKTSQYRQNFGQTNMSRFQKSKLQVNRYPRASYERQSRQPKNRSILDFAKNDGILNQQRYALKENFVNFKNSETENSSEPFKKSDQLHFLTQCSKLYRLKPKENRILNAQEEAESVKSLLNQINKRDAVYDVVTKKLGFQQVEQKLVQFFEKSNKMRKIIDQFKKMSKLNIQDDEQLYNFLINDQQDKQNQFKSNPNMDKNKIEASQ